MTAGHTYKIYKKLIQGKGGNEIKVKRIKEWKN
jgi:hypothetical protein